MYRSLHLMTRQLLFGGKVLMVSIKNGRRISSLRAFGPGGGQIWRVVHVSARAPFCVLGKNRCLAYAKRHLLIKIVSGLRETIFFEGKSHLA